MSNDRGDQRLTSVQSPLGPGELPEIAILLMVGSAESPGLPARGRLHFVGTGLGIGRRAPDDKEAAAEPGAGTAVLNDTLVSGRHARIAKAGAAYEIVDLGSKN